MIHDKLKKLRELGREYFQDRRNVEEYLQKAKTAIGELADAKDVEEMTLHKYLKELERLAGVD